MYLLVLSGLLKTNNAARVCGWLFVDVGRVGDAVGETCLFVFIHTQIIWLVCLAHHQTHLHGPLWTNRSSRVVAGYPSRLLLLRLGRVPLSSC